MSRNGWIRSTLTLLLVAAPAVRADEPTPGDPPRQNAESQDNKFKLGEVTVVVTADQDPLETAHSTLDAEQIQEMNRDTVSSAMELLPGVSTTIGTRNERMVYLRGFDAKQVPLFIDGVPSYVPYDGSMDYNRFTTFDLSEIQVAKGFSSVTYGANTLGGAINLVTRRPALPLEGDIRLGFFEGGGRKTAVNFGTNQGRWYLQAGGSYSQADSWRMSSDFKPTPYENGGNRLNSDFTDTRFSLKLGFTPNDRDEYVIGATRQTGEKGQPPSTTVAPKYWRWPTWDKDSLFVATNTALGEKSYVKFNAYFDTYQNTAVSYTDATYTNRSTFLGTNGESFYDDFTHGAKVEFGTLLLPRQNAKLMIQSKTDVHRSDSKAIPATKDWPHYEDRYLDWGVEDTVSLSPSVDLSLGAGWDHLKPVDSGPDYALPGSRGFFHGQVGLFWRAAPKVQLYTTFAQKDRFPSLSDRYSAKQNKYKPNPELKPEQSRNWEVGARTHPAEWVQLDAALFLSDIQDLIQPVDLGIPNPNYKNTNWMQYRNIGKVRHSGVELSADFKPCEVFRAGVGYTYLDRSIRSDPDTSLASKRLTGTPRNRATGYLRYEPVPAFYLLASIQSQDSLWDTENVSLGGFTTVDLTLGWKPTPRLLIDGGFTNLFDRNYELSDGYPLAGRTWFVNGRYRF